MTHGSVRGPSGPYSPEVVDADPTAQDAKERLLTRARTAVMDPTAVDQVVEVTDATGTVHGFQYVPATRSWCHTIRTVDGDWTRLTDRDVVRSWLVRRWPDAELVRLEVSVFSPEVADA